MSPILLALSCLLRPFLYVLNQQTTNHFSLLPLRSPNENASRVTLASGPTQLCPRAGPHGPEGTQACGTFAVPVSEVGKQVPEAKCQSQESRAHFSLAPELLTP